MLPFDRFPVWLFVVKKEWLLDLYIPDYLSVAKIVSHMNSHFGHGEWFKDRFKVLGFKSLFFNNINIKSNSLLLLISGFMCLL